MRSSWRAFFILAALCSLVLAAVSGVCRAEEKHIMIVVTADTQGEINPCG